jgi:hypothetical protein
MRHAFVCLAIIAGASAACAGEIVFREEFSGGLPAGWRFVNERGDCSGEWDAAEPPGEGAGSLRCDLTADASARATWAAPRISLKPATTYRLRFRVMLGEITEGARGAYVILYENGEPAPTHWHMSEYMRGSQDWHEREVVFTTRDDCEWGELQLKLWECTGYAWYDDVVIEELDASETVVAAAETGRLVLPEDDGFSLQTIWYPAHRRADQTLHLLPDRLNPVAMFIYGRRDEVTDPHLIIEAPRELTIRGPVVCAREPLPEAVALTPEPIESDGAAYLRWRLPIRADTLTAGMQPDGPNWTRYHFIYAEPGANCPAEFAWNWRFESAGEVGPLHTIKARLQPNLGANIEPVEGFALYAQHSDALRLPERADRERVLDYLHYAGVRGGLALSYYQPELVSVDDELAEKGWFTWTWRWYGYGGPAEDDQRIVYDNAATAQRATTCPQVQVEMLEPHASYLREFYANALALDRDWLILNYEPPVFNVCFCERCRRTFAEQTGRPADEVLAMTPQEIQALPGNAWGRFRAWQNERIIKNHAAIIREIDPDCLFGVCGPAWTHWNADRGQDIRRFEPEVGLHAPMIYRPPQDYEPLVRSTCEATSALVMPFMLGSDIAIPATFPDAWDQWANMLATALSGADGAILWVGIESLDGEITNVLRQSMEQIRLLRPFIAGAEVGAGVAIEPQVRDLRVVNVGDRRIEVGSENSLIPVRDWQWSGPRGRMLALINYDRAQSHEVRLSAPDMSAPRVLFGPAPTADGEALVIDLGPGELAAVAWE